MKVNTCDKIQYKTAYLGVLVPLKGEKKHLAIFPGIFLVWNFVGNHRKVYNEIANKGGKVTFSFVPVLKSSL